MSDEHVEQIELVEQPHGEQPLKKRVYRKAKASDKRRQTSKLNIQKARLAKLKKLKTIREAENEENDGDNDSDPIIAEPVSNRVQPNDLYDNSDSETDSDDDNEIVIKPRKRVRKESKAVRRTAKAAVEKHKPEPSSSSELAGIGTELKNLKSIINDLANAQANRVKRNRKKATKQVFHIHPNARKPANKLSEDLKKQLLIRF